MPLPVFKKGQTVIYLGQKSTISCVRQGPKSFLYDLEMPDGAAVNVPADRIQPWYAYLADHDRRITQLESLMASMNAIDTPTIDRCIETAKNSLRELSDVLGETAQLTGDLPSKRRVMAVQQTLAKVHELENMLRQVELPAVSRGSGEERTITGRRPSHPDLQSLPEPRSPSFSTDFSELEKRVASIGPRDDTFLRPGE